ncbi:MAG TPA: translation initiation factor IF-3 [Nitrosomonas sp.]|nr:translation initiation factor IF-3 [Nitrosomonas sp.]HMW21491.1 translation initiation factor IF-3 [Nitrosomonas sp.]HMW69797.1 translation initiation factor IF-3 [Nitrosomonas sp.]HMY62310.1 translation initiation factor IF-3 [Nitrosomonas sp.]HMY90673.1 translation initiation factor IF-3 [Nitrosomonas sp.]
MIQERSVRINEEINAPVVRLIGLKGEQLGVVSLTDANARAEEESVDLVEIAPGADPPVCRLMDYGKYLYQESKKKHDAKLKQKQVQVKEIKFRPNTDEGDYNIKLRSIINFLDDGDKVKITLRFRGREMAHQEFGVRLLDRIKEDLQTYGLVEQHPKLEGRQMVMVLSPKKKEVKSAKSKESTKEKDKPETIISS